MDPSVKPSLVGLKQIVAQNEVVSLDRSISSAIREHRTVVRGALAQAMAQPAEMRRVHNPAALAELHFPRERASRRI